MIEAPLFFERHGACRHRKSFAVRKLYHDTKQIPTSRSLSQDIVDGILSKGLGPLDKRLSEAHLFNFFRLDGVLGNVSNPVFRPNQLMDFHASECTGVNVPRQQKRLAPVKLRHSDREKQLLHGRSCPCAWASDTFRYECQYNATVSCLRVWKHSGQWKGRGPQGSVGLSVAALTVSLRWSCPNLHRMVDISEPPNVATHPPRPNRARSC